MKLQPVLERVQIEQNELLSKLQKLEQYLGGNPQYSDRQLALLEWQYAAMTMYSDVLGARIADFTEQLHRQNIFD